MTEPLRPSRRPHYFQTQLELASPIRSRAANAAHPALGRLPATIALGALLLAGCAARPSAAESPALPGPTHEASGGTPAAPSAAPERAEASSQQPARAGLADRLQLTVSPPPAAAPIPWTISIEQPSAAAFESGEQALAAPVRLRGREALPANTELRLKVDSYRSWSVDELEQRGWTPGRWRLSMLVDELRGLAPGPHRLSVFATTPDGVVVRQPELAATSHRFDVGSSRVPASSGASALPARAEPPAYWFSPEGTLNGSAAAQDARLQFHAPARERVWLRVTAPDGSRRLHELTAEAYQLTGWVSGDYHFALLKAADAPPLVEQVVTVNLDMPSAEAQESSP